MSHCPFKKKECTSECAYFAPGVKKCCLPTNTMLLEDLHKLSLVLLDNAILKEEDDDKRGEKAALKGKIMKKDLEK